jgi:hypothetical protein
MGDHGAKTVLTTSGMYALAGMPKRRVSRLVGDDQTTVSRQPELVADSYRLRMESLGYELSEDDTFISKVVFFAEDAFVVETDPNSTVEVWMSRKKRSHLPFIDFPKVKILSDAGKEIGSFSESAIGKITLLGTKMEQTSKTYAEALFHLASWMQDICISLIYRKEFVYFPRFLVQTGKPPLFRSIMNAKAFLRMHRQGRLEESYADIMDQALRPTRHGQRIIQSFLTHGKSDNQIRICKMDFKHEVFYEHRLFTQEFIKGYEPFIVTRLAKKVISESEIVAKLAERENLLGTARSTVYKRLTVDNLSRGQKPLSDELLQSFTNAWQLNSKLLRIRHEETYYDREAVEEFLDFQHPLRVSGILDGTLSDEDSIPITQNEHDREVNKLYNWLKDNPQRIDDIPRALLRDDLFVLSGEYLTVPELLIVSDDRKLINTASVMRGYDWNARNRVTYCISIWAWIRSDLTASPVFEPNAVFIDTGSLDGYLDNHPEDDCLGDGQTIEGRYHLVRPTANLDLPQEYLEMKNLRSLPPIAEE